MDIEEARRRMVEKLVAEEAAQNEERWAEGKVAITLVPSSNDPEVFSAEYQTELQALRQALRLANIEASSTTLTLDSAVSFGGQIGEFVIPIAKYGLPALSGIVAGWLKGRSGRVAKVEFFANGSPKKIEAPTAEQVISMLQEVRSEAQVKPRAGK